MSTGGGGGDELAERYRVDRVDFTPGPHDVRVARRGWVLYVRAVRDGERLLGPRVGLEGLALYLVVQVLHWWLDLTLAELLWLAAGGGLLVTGVNAVRWRRLRARPWRVGVVRGPDPASWNVGPPVVEHEEELAIGADPAARVAELAAECRAGRFDPPAPEQARG